MDWIHTNPPTDTVTQILIECNLGTDLGAKKNCTKEQNSIQKRTWLLLGNERD